MPIRKDEVNPVDSGLMLRRHFDQFTQSQKRVAKYIIEHSQAVAFSTVDKMAAPRARWIPRFAGADTRTSARTALAHRHSGQRKPGRASS